MRRLPLIGLLIAAAAQNVAYTILIPFVPTLQEQYAMDPFSIGLAFAGFTVTKAVCQPLGGRGVDRFGPRRIGLLGFVITTIATALMAAADTGYHIVILRLVWGVGSGLVMPALYRLLILLGERSGIGSTRAVGWFGAAAVLGMSAGPGIVAAFSSSLGFRTAFLIGSAFYLVSAGLIVLVTRQTSPEVRRAAEATDLPAAPPTALRTARTVVTGLGMLDLANNFVYASIEPVLPLYASGSLRASERGISTVFALGLLVFAAASPLGAAATARLRPLDLCSVTLALQATVLVLPVVTNDTTLLTIAFLVLMAAQPCVYVGVRSALTSLRQADQGAAFGWFGMLGDIGWTVGPLLMTPLFVGVQERSFVFLSALACVSIALSWSLARTPRLRSRFVS